VSADAPVRASFEREDRIGEAARASMKRQKRPPPKE
jgi:hypothetical protein